MKKLFSALLAAALVAGSAISASAGMFVFDSSDSEYWDAALNMLDKTQKVFWMEDGAAADWSISVDANSVEYDTNKLSNLESGWYEIVLCDLGTNPEWFPAEVEGKIALTLRGDSTFTVKSTNALDAGAIACLVANNCRDEEMIDENGDVTTGTYQVTNMSVEYETLPMGMVSSDVTVRLVSKMTGLSMADTVAAVREVFGGKLELGLEAKNTAWMFFGTEEEYKANTTRTDANTKTGAGAAAAAPAPAATEEAPAADASETIAIDAAASYQDYPSMDVVANNGAGYATAEEAVASLGKTAITGYTFVSGTEGFGNEGPENLWDGDTATKFCTGTYPTISIVALDGEYAIDGIAMATANDNAEYPGRAPFEWAVYGSKDGENWTAFAYGDDYFFEDVNFTYYAAPVTTADTYKYVMFQSEGGLAGVFQVSEMVLTGTKVEAAAPAVEEAPVVEEPVVEEVVEEPVVEEPVIVEEEAAEEVVEEEVAVEEPVVEEVIEEEVVEEAAQTFDFGVIAAVAALLSAAGYAVSKKR